MASSTDEKVRENRVRRMAERQGLRLVKSRRRDPRALDYGGYWLLNAYNAVVEGGEHGEPLDTIEWKLSDD